MKRYGYRPEYSCPSCGGILFGLNGRHWDGRASYQGKTYQSLGCGWCGVLLYNGMPHEVKLAILRERDEPT